MTDKCFDIGTMQAFLDGELAAEMTETVARHVAACDECACLLAESEEESALTFSALEMELNALVPTQRLWTKINDSIAREKKSFWKPILAFLLQPQTAAFASLIFVAVLSVTLLSLKPNAPTNYVAQTGEIQQKNNSADCKKSVVAACSNAAAFARRKKHGNDKIRSKQSRIPGSKNCLR